MPQPQTDQTNFRFALNQPIAIKLSGETGIVIGRAEYLAGDAQYQIHYKNAHSAAVTEWLPESLIEPAQN